MRLFILACLGFCTFGVLPTFVDAMAEKRAYDFETAGTMRMASLQPHAGEVPKPGYQSTSEAEQIGILEDTGWQSSRKKSTLTKASSEVLIGGLSSRLSSASLNTRKSKATLSWKTLTVASTGNQATLTALSYLSSSAAGRSRSSDQATVAPKPSPRQNGAVMELSVYASRYDGRVTKYSRTYSHWNGTTCASNNPAHKMKVLRVTYKGKSIDLLCIDTGGDKRLGYTRLDISGKAMKFFAPKWNGKDKGAPLLKGATVQVVK